MINDNDMTTLTVCGELDTMISAGSPPDLVLDFTLTGKTSEAMKQISRSLGLPTVTSAIGEEKEIWSWADLSPAQQGYLVQVSRVEHSHWSRYWPDTLL